MVENHFIITKTYEQFRSCRKVNTPKTRYVYLQDERMLLGRRNPHGIFLYDWYERPDAESIIQRLWACYDFGNGEPNKGIQRAYDLYQKMKSK